MTNPHTRLVLVSGILILGVFAGITVPVQATDPTDWTTTSLASITGGVTLIDAEVVAAHDSEKTAILYKVGDSTRFMLCLANCTVASNWVVKNADTSGAVAQSTSVHSRLAHLGGTEWAYTHVGETLGNFDIYSTIDDGVTWVRHGNTLSCNSCRLMDIAGTGTGGLYVTYVNVATGDDLYFDQSSDLGATWEASTPRQKINDNQAFTGGGASKITPILAARILVDSPAHVMVMFQGGVDSAQVFSVSTTDGTYWTIPYTVEAGSTSSPSDTTNCPQSGAFSQDAGIMVAGTWQDNNYEAWFPRKNGASNQYLCSFNVAGGQPYPSAAPTNSHRNAGKAGTISGGTPGLHNRAIATNGLQFVVAGEQLTANRNYVLFKPSSDATTWAEVYTTNSNANIFSLTATPTQAYFVFVPNGGPLTIAGAEMSASDIPVTQVAVTDLTGYAMDQAGANIIVRTDDGNIVETYGVGDLEAGAISTVSTPDCNADGTQFDGVAIDRFDDGDSVETFAVFVDCSADGDSDAFHIRTVDLTTAPTYGCNQATPNVENDGDIVIPENLGEIGLISDLNPSYANGRCVDSAIVDFAAIAFSFSTVGTLAEGGGKIGTVAMVYNTGPDYTDTDLEVLDSNPFPEIDQFCGWTNYATGRDFIGAVAAAGPTKVFEIESSIVDVGPGADAQKPEVDLVPQFSNAGQYGNAVGLGCAGDSITILKATQAFWLNNVDGTETTQSGWPIAISGVTKERGIAMTGSGNFTAIVDGSKIIVYAKNGTQTGSFPVPDGTWRGMEFDYSGEYLAVFTSDFITVYETTTITCQLLDSCAGDGNIGTGDPDTGTHDGSSSTSTCSSFLCADDENVPEGFTAAMFNLFLGVILMLSISAGLYFTTKSPMLGVVGAIGGFLIGFAFGLFPLWIIVVLVVLAVAVIFLRTKAAAT